MEPNQHPPSAVRSVALNVLENSEPSSAILSAVERFAQKHEQAKVPLQTKYYRDLIPLTKPGKDQQYSFEVDLDR